jgi:hypothetical protein
LKLTTRRKISTVVQVGCDIVELLHIVEVHEAKLRQTTAGLRMPFWAEADHGIVVWNGTVRQTLPSSENEDGSENEGLPYGQAIAPIGEHQTIEILVAETPLGGLSAIELGVKSNPPPAKAYVSGVRSPRRPAPAFIGLDLDTFELNVFERTIELTQDVAVVGDRVRAIIDPAGRWIRFYRNGVPCGIGYIGDGVQHEARPFQWAIGLLCEGASASALIIDAEASEAVLSLTVKTPAGKSVCIRIPGRSTVQELKQVLPVEVNWLPRSRVCCTPAPPLISRTVLFQHPGIYCCPSSMVELFTPSAGEEPLSDDTQLCEVGIAGDQGTVFLLERAS